MKLFLKASGYNVPLRQATPSSSLRGGGEACVLLEAAGSI